MLAILLSAVSNANIDLALVILGTIAVLYLVFRKFKTWSDDHPDDLAALLDKIGLHKMARAIWDELAAKQAEEEANRYLGVSH